MLALFGNRKTNPEKEKLIRNIVSLFSREIEITDGKITVCESDEKEGLILINIEVGFVIDCCEDLLRFSEILKNVFYMAIDPSGDKISIRFGIENVFEQ